MNPCLSRSIISKARRSSSSAKARPCRPGIINTSSSDFVFGAALTFASCIAVAAALGFTGTATWSDLPSCSRLLPGLYGCFGKASCLVSATTPVCAPPGSAKAGGGCGGGRAFRLGKVGSAGASAGTAAAASANKPPGGGGGGNGNESNEDDPGNAAGKDVPVPGGGFGGTGGAPRADPPPNAAGKAGLMPAALGVAVPA
mmetsp:Transcript_23456/g.54188  ORF Transcript_23456/g.54188 Transcript_23456/m.54188 type:complete len:200 (+) Transcript_23456:946-1545(+)